MTTTFYPGELADIYLYAKDDDEVAIAVTVNQIEILAPNRSVLSAHGLVLNLDNKDNPQNFVVLFFCGAEQIVLMKIVNGVATTLITSQSTSGYSSGSNKGEFIVYKDVNTYTVFYVISGRYFRVGSAVVNDESIINNTRHECSGELGCGG